MEINIKDLSLEQCDEVMKQIEQQKKELLGKSKQELMEERFLEILNSGLVIKRDVVEDTTKYTKDGEWVLFLDHARKKCWIRYNYIWSIFKSEFGCNYKEIKEFLDGMLEKHLNCKGYTTTFLFFKK